MRLESTWYVSLGSGVGRARRGKRDRSMQAKDNEGLVVSLQPFIRSRTEFRDTGSALQGTARSAMNVSIATEY